MTWEREQRLVDALFERTKQGPLGWKPSVGKDSYILSFPDSSVIIRPDTASPNSAIAMEITNDDGQIVDRFRDYDLVARNGANPGEWVSKMKTIHQSARRTVLRADAILDSLIERLEH